MVRSTRSISTHAHCGQAEGTGHTQPSGDCALDKVLQVGRSTELLPGTPHNYTVYIYATIMLAPAHQLVEIG